MTRMRYYRQLLGDEPRVAAFRRAINAVVREGDHVLDVGAGLGTFSFFAVEAGAERVWAVDRDPVIHAAKAVAAANGYGERIEFVRGSIPEVSLPVKADVVLFEDFPPRLLDPSTFRILREVHRRYVAAPVRVVPQRANMVVAPARSERIWRQALACGDGNGEVAYGVDWSATRDYAANSPLRARLETAELVGPPSVVGELRLDRPPDAGGFAGEAIWTVAHGGPIHGLAYWFDLELAPDLWLSNAPGRDGASWGHLFLPIDPPLAVSAGSRVRGSVRRDPLPDGATGWLAWCVESGAASARGHEFGAEPASLEDMVLATPEAQPVLSRRAYLEAVVLRLTDGMRSVRQIATEFRAEHGELSQTDAELLVVQALRGRARMAKQPALAYPPGGVHDGS